MQIVKNIILVQADKGRTIFVVDNSVYECIRDPTEKYQKQLQKILQQSNKIIDKHKIKYLLQNKPKPPTLNAQLKLHKPNIPIRPVVNNINAPTYKVAKRLTKILNDHLDLNNQHVVHNSTKLAHDLVKFKINDNHRFLTYDIKDLFVNITIKRYYTLPNNTSSTNL
jgi:hypothetical protein